VEETVAGALFGAETTTVSFGGIAVLLGAGAALSFVTAGADCSVARGFGGAFAGENVTFGCTIGAGVVNAVAVGFSTAFVSTGFDWDTAGVFVVGGRAEATLAELLEELRRLGEARCSVESSAAEAGALGIVWESRLARRLSACSSAGADGSSGGQFGGVTIQSVNLPAFARSTVTNGPLALAESPNHCL
jgi:hypothetical protein